MTSSGDGGNGKEQQNAERIEPGEIEEDRSYKGYSER
jgi:hypothetical protein